MKVLITGAVGMLGVAVVDQLRSGQYEMISTSRRAHGEGALPLDIRDWQAVRQSFAEHEPELVIHLAAETNVDRCEQEPDHALATNAFGTENIARACQCTGAILVYVSTANVFDGEKLEPYIEYDLPGSINAYGRSKLAGERIVEQALDRYFIFRAGWMVGGWDIDKKFVRKIAQMCGEQDQLKVVDDKFGSLTFTSDFASHMMQVVDSGRYGLYHLANRGTASRLQIAEEIVAIMGLAEKIEVLPISSAEFPLPAPRPRSEMLRNLKLELLGMNTLPLWQDALADYIKMNVSRG